MNKSVIAVVFLSIACCVGFMGGVLFGGFYNKDIVVETISEYEKVQVIEGWYKLIMINDLLIKNLEKIASLNDVEALKEKYKKNCLKFKVAVG